MQYHFEAKSLAIISGSGSHQRRAHAWFPEAANQRYGFIEEECNLARNLAWSEDVAGRFDPLSARSDESSVALKV